VGKSTDLEKENRSLPETSVPRKACGPRTDLSRTHSYYLHLLPLAEDPSKKGKPPWGGIHRLSPSYLPSVSLWSRMDRLP